MRNISKSIFIFSILFLCSLLSIAQVHVRGYTRSNGTYVQPHYRSNPDGNPYNNWSFPGNVNPMTGKIATGDPDTYLKNYYDKKDKSITGNSSSNNYSFEDLVKEVERTSGQYNSPNTNQYEFKLSPESLPRSTWSSSEGFKIKYAKQGAWIRKGPGSKYAAIYQASIMQEIEIIDNYPNGWSKISFTYINRNFEFSQRTGFIPTNRITTVAL